jgi:polyhydroxyalkanoate synthesis repressor PhaR
MTVRTIKRYSNRKLYDTTDSRYVTLQQIAGLIRNGDEIRVIDKTTQQDLTAATMAQIIFEEEKKKNQMPLAVLREIIRHPGESISGFIQKEVTPRVASIREEAEQRLDKLLGREDKHADEAAPPEQKDGEQSPAASAKSGLSPAELLKASQRAFEEWQQKIDERVKNAVEGLTGNLPALGRDMQSLMQRLEDLEKKIAELEQQQKS